MKPTIRNNSMDSGNTASPPPPRKKRCLFIDFQRDYLTQFYDNTRHYPTPEEYALFAMRFNISELQVKTWFQNRRTRHKRRNRVPPLKSKSETWDKEKILTLEPPIVVVPSGFSTDIWEVWESVVQKQINQTTNAVLWQNPSMFQPSYQEFLTYQGQGFVPSLLYEAQAWLKKKREWKIYWENVIKSQN